jgi:hypothetical protein
MNRPYSTTDILALDIATTTGWARGAPGEMPRSGSVRFGKAASSTDVVFAEALRWLSNFLKVDPPTSIMLEAMLPPQAMKNETSRATRDRLAGLHGVLRGVAHCRGVCEISTVSTLTARHHFCGTRAASKDDVFDKCRALGWPAQDHNAADACAVWSFACGLVAPETALMVSPLFKRKAAFA